MKAALTIKETWTSSGKGIASSGRRKKAAGSAPTARAAFPTTRDSVPAAEAGWTEAACSWRSGLGAVLLHHHVFQQQHEYHPDNQAVAQNGAQVGGKLSDKRIRQQAGQDAHQHRQSDDEVIPARQAARSADGRCLWPRRVWRVPWRPQGGRRHHASGTEVKRAVILFRKASDQNEAAGGHSITASDPRDVMTPGLRRVGHRAQQAHGAGAKPLKPVRTRLRLRRFSIPSAPTRG